MSLVARAVGSALLGPGPALLCLSGLAWIAVFAVEGALRATVCGSLLRVWLSAATDLSSCVTAAAAWSMLTLAMMAPVLGQPVDHVWRSTPTRHRLAAAIVFLASYVLVWVMAGAVLALAAAPLASTSAPVDLGIFGLVLFLAWQMCPWKQVCLNRCHQRRPLAPFGLKAFSDRVAFGLEVGTWCVGSCWALMFAMLVASADHGFFMLAACALIFLERQLPTKAVGWGAMLRP